LLYVGIALLGVGVLVAIAGLLQRLKAKKILGAPVVQTGAIAANQPVAGANGLVSCEGAARAQQPIAAPCSNQPCVYYRLKLEKKVKVKKGNQSTVSWKPVSEHSQGTFYVDDGSGGVWVQPEGLEADLTRTFSGPPPAHLAHLVAASGPGKHGEEILEHRATEDIIPAEARVFVMGTLAAGQITRPLVSTRGRAAVIGSKQKIGAVLVAAGVVLGAVGVPIMIFRPGTAPLCAAVTDDPAKPCRVETQVVEKDRKQSDGSTKKETFREKILTWEVTKNAKFELEARSTSSSPKDSSYPVVQVESAIGFPVNFGLNAGFGSESAKVFKTKTTTLSPGKFTIYVWAQKEGASDYTLAIKELRTETAAQ